MANGNVSHQAHKKMGVQNTAGLIANIEMVFYETHGQLAKEYFLCDLRESNFCGPAYRQAGFA
jgi:hypothetical protein